MYLECMKSWIVIRQYISYQEKEFIIVITEEVDKEYTKKDIEIIDVENIWILVAAWIELEKAERIMLWYKKVIYFVKDKLGEKHEIYADALVEYVNYYEVMTDYIMCEKLCNQAIEIWKGMIYRVQSKFDKALKI